MTTVHEPTDTARAAYIDGLHEMADWIAAHPDLPTPYGITDSTYPVPGAHGQIGFKTRHELERIAAHYGVKLEDRAGAGQCSGTYRTGRISLTLVWFAPTSIVADVAEAVLAS